jgi:hypothetical protein
MLAWARESARLTIDEAAHKIGIAADKLAACEAGEAQLTFPQFMKAAREYRRPASLFYLKSPPAGWAPIQDFRQLAGAEAGFSPRLAYVIRQARERREVALDHSSPLFVKPAIDSYTRWPWCQEHQHLRGGLVAVIRQPRESRAERFAQVPLDVLSSLTS